MVDRHMRPWGTVATVGLLAVTRPLHRTACRERTCDSSARPVANELTPAPGRHKVRSRAARVANVGSGDGTAGSPSDDAGATGMLRLDASKEAGLGLVRRQYPGRVAPLPPRELPI
jgi:hypothetical protein